MKRRVFIRNILAAGSLSAVPGLMKATPFDFRSMKKAPKCIKPPRLKRGDLIGLLAPASPFSDEKFQRAVQQIENIGLKVQFAPRLRKRHGYLAGTDKDRQNDLHDFFRDPKIKGLWCIRGGYGSGRLLPTLDYRLIRKNPKPLIGYSDITALLNGIYQHSGLVGFHGPVASSAINDYSTLQLRTVLMDAPPTWKIMPPDDAPAFDVIHSGKAEGRLMGGNLSLLSAMVGTGYLPKVKNKILFIEEVGEKPYRTDRMLTQLLQALPLHKAAAIVLGTFSGCEAREGDDSLSLSQVLKDRLGQLGIPVIYGLPFGHIDQQCTLPIGIKASIDTASGVLTLLEPGVI